MLVNVAMWTRTLHMSSGREFVRLSGVSVKMWTRLQGGYQRAFGPKHSLKWSRLESNLNVGGLWTLGWHHVSSMENMLCFFLYFFFFYVWRRGHQLLQLYWIWLQHCLPLRLQKGFVDSNTLLVELHLKIKICFEFHYFLLTPVFPSNFPVLCIDK